MMLKIKKIALISLGLLLFLGTLNAQTNDDCMMCHEDKDLTAERYGKTVSMYVNQPLLLKSAHSKVECVSCHKDLAGSEFPHVERLKKVNCGSCHKHYSEQVKNDIHNTFMKSTCDNPPSCKTCHNTHGVKKPGNVKNKSKEFCGKCHEEEVLSSTYHISNGINDGCIDCHDEIDYKAKMGGSVHSNLECSNCHGYVVNNLKRHETEKGVRASADCYLCHGSIASEHKESIHGIALEEGMNESAHCWDCHGSHEITKISSKESMVSPINVIATCGNCHDDPNFSEKHYSSMKQPGISYSNSIHGKLLKEGRTDVANCITCHGVHNIKNRIQPDSKISSVNISKGCAECHKEISEEYEQSIHWMSVKKGVQESPTCNDCHSEHGVHAINTDDKYEQIKILQENTCLECHQNLLLSSRFGIDGESAGNYQDSYHGLAVMRGDEDAAMCIDCHGVHKILPKYHEESLIHVDNVTETCAKCHEGSSTVFSQSYSHTSNDDSAKYIEDIVQSIYFWLIVIVIGGMAVHNLIIFIYDLRKKRTEINKAIRIPRFTRNELIQHVILLVSFSILAITGFQLKYPDSWWSEGLSWLGLDEVARQWTHRISAVVMIGLSIWHVVYLIITARGRDVLKSMFPNMRDIKQAGHNIMYHLHLRKKHPEFDNYNYIEKAEYWALIWGTMVMGLTGFILWFPTVVGDWAPLWVIKVSEIVHFYEAILATLAIIVWHWFFVMFRPQEYPMSFTCVDGKMTIVHFKDEHMLKYKKVMLEWMELKAGKITKKQLSHFGNLFINAVEKAEVDVDEFIQNEIKTDLNLKNYLRENDIEI